MENQTERDNLPLSENVNEEKSSSKHTVGQNLQRSHRKSSSLRAAGQWRSAVNHVRAHSHNDVEGRSNLANTGPFIDYDNT